VANVWSVVDTTLKRRVVSNVTIIDGLIHLSVIGTSRGKRVLQFDPVSLKWTKFAPIFITRNGGSSFALGGSLFAVGGKEEPSSVERYDAATSAWTMVADMLEGRDSHRLLLSPSDQQARPGSRTSSTP
jgi:hypothetical protein